MFTLTYSSVKPHNITGRNLFDLTNLFMTFSEQRPELDQDSRRILRETKAKTMPIECSFKCSRDFVRQSRPVKKTSCRSQHLKREAKAVQGCWSYRCGVKS